MRTSISITGSVDTLATDFTRRLYPERMPVLRDLYLGGSAAPDDVRRGASAAGFLAVPDREPNRRTAPRSAASMPAR